MASDRPVKQGDCMTSIADETGFFWQTLWNHARNAALKQERRDPNVLQPGDRVHVPDKQRKEESGATEKRHRFVRKGTPARFRLRLLEDDEPIANQRFVLLVDGQTTTGSTDRDGMLDVPLPPRAREGELRVGEGDTLRLYQLSFGHIDPIETESGVLGRLGDLGFATEEDPHGAIRAFQAEQGLRETGTVDQATRDRLKEVFGI